MLSPDGDLGEMRNAADDLLRPESSVHAARITAARAAPSQLTVRSQSRRGVRGHRARLRWGLSGPVADLRKQVQRGLLLSCADTPFRGLNRVQLDHLTVDEPHTQAARRTFVVPIGQILQPARSDRIDFTVARYVVGHGGHHAVSIDCAEDAVC
ncbi:hypothetical protein ADL15_11735 [Actinoplanes awajinensis subsp. mycoplanecinus]|uniref:Uncharacterized protein n=1 Tax=Actinoplanes awajinensis subsp. mycoplanecinus TaxID=135947 RepID=A0A0X3UZ46_9ACTN|nr:hypothetical protein ADL15_11735 [Actinoplanes awajinensis subsp. mycoplanecinus]